MLFCRTALREGIELHYQAAVGHVYLDRPADFKAGILQPVAFNSHPGGACAPIGHLKGPYRFNARGNSGVCASVDAELTSAGSLDSALAMVILLFRLALVRRPTVFHHCRAPLISS